MKNITQAILLSALLVVGCKESSVGPHRNGPGPDSDPPELYYTIFDNEEQETWIYAINADGTNRRMIAEQSAIFSSPIGDRFAGAGPFGGIVIRTLSGELIQAIGPASNSFSYPVFSPAGNKVAYRKFINAPDKRTQLYIINTDGTNDILVEADAANETVPVWSPDGTKLAYLKQGVEVAGIDNDSLFVVNSDGTGRRFLAAGAVSMNDNMESLDWSPDGTRLVCIAETAQQVYEVLVVNAVTGAVNTITSDGLPKAMPVWSPNSGKIAYVGADSPSRLSVFTIDTDGTDRQGYPISETRQIAFPQWSPNGAYISVTEEIDDADGLLRVVDLSSGAVRTVDSAIYRAYWRK